MKELKNLDLEMQAVYDKALKNLLETDDCLDENEKSAIADYVLELKLKESLLEKAILRYGSLLNYDELKQNGFDKDKINAIFDEDKAYVAGVENSFMNNHKKRDYMFGYPSNMEKDSYLSSYLRYLESKLYLMNNCGDPYERGNYGMDSKETEQTILEIFAENFGLKEGEYWGYVTSGGTESNFWAIREGFTRFKSGVLYFSEDAHYSVEKYVATNPSAYPYVKVKTMSSGKIDVEDFKNKVTETNQKYGYKPVIVVLTWGTTKEGAIDDVKEITDYLKNNDIEYYCHLDAALFGGIDKNQQNAPFITDLLSLNVDSVSVSLHKYLGASRANGILISLKKGVSKKIDYIGQEDSTFLGSRDFPPFSTLQRIKEFKRRKTSDHYSKNVRFFTRLLKENGVFYKTFNDETNIFVINKPSDAICKKYQLATFSADGKDMAHIIIMPFHSEKIIEELVSDLKNDDSNP